MCDIPTICFQNQGPCPIILSKSLVEMVCSCKGLVFSICYLILLEGVIWDVDSAKDLEQIYDKGIDFSFIYTVIWSLW